MSAERDRFLRLFDALVVASNRWIEKTPREKLDWYPFDNSNMKFGDRISEITIRSLYIHTIVGEHGWARMLEDCEDGAAFRPQPEKDLIERLTGSEDLVAEAMKIHADNMRLFASYGNAQLAKRIRWVDREWTVMGFMWGIYSHRSYHLGNIDIYLREADEPAPDFFSTFQSVLA